MLQAESLVDKVVTCILDALRQGTYVPGDKLPSHEKLQKDYGVSRNTLREALNRLEFLGVLRIRHGDGTYVSEVGAISSVNPLVSLLKLRGTALDELIDARIFVEEKTATLAAQRASDKEKHSLSRLLVPMNEAIADPVLYASLDLRFHREIARIAHNTLFLEFFDIIRGLMAAQQAEIAKMPKVPASSQRFHEEIVTYIHDGNSAAVAETMRRHIESAYSRLQPLEAARKPKEKARRGQ